MNNNELIIQAEDMYKECMELYKKYYSEFGENINFNHIVSMGIDDIIELLKDLNLQYLKKVEEYEKSQPYDDSIIVEWKYKDIKKAYRYCFNNLKKVEYTSRSFPLLDWLLGKKCYTTDHSRLNLPFLVMVIIWKRQDVPNYKLNMRSEQFLSIIERHDFETSKIDFNLIFKTLSE
jgi:hypothetical protein